MIGCLQSSAAKEPRRNSVFILIYGLNSQLEQNADLGQRFTDLNSERDVLQEIKIFFDMTASQNGIQVIFH